MPASTSSRSTATVSSNCPAAICSPRSAHTMIMSRCRGCARASRSHETRTSAPRSCARCQSCVHTSARNRSISAGSPNRSRYTCRGSQSMSTPPRSNTTARMAWHFTARVSHRRLPGPAGGNRMCSGGCRRAAWPAPPQPTGLPGSGPPGCRAAAAAAIGGGCVPVARSLETLLAVAATAALAPVIRAALPRLRIPQVVLQIFANVGLGFLFLLAGYEIDLRLLRDSAGRLAMAGWAASAAISVVAVAGLTAAGMVRDFVPVALALTTTALGTLLPILQDNDMMSGRFGRHVLAAGAVGELFPIIAISLFLTRRAQFVAIASLLAVAAGSVALAIVPQIIGRERLRAGIRQGRRATAQAALRWAFVLLLVLLVGALQFGLDVVLGALLAGIVLRTWTRQMDFDVQPLEDKLEAVGYGVFIPVFFVASGMSLDVVAVLRDPVRLLIFAGLLLAVRGLPSLVIYRHALTPRERGEMTFVTATTMPLLIALAEIGLRDGVMLPANAAALIGAGVLSVLVYPQIAAALARGGRRQPAAPPAEATVPPRA